MQNKKNIDLSERKGVHQFLQNKNVSRIVEIRLPYVRRPLTEKIRLIREMNSTFYQSLLICQDKIR